MEKADSPAVGTGGRGGVLTPHRQTDTGGGGEEGGDWREPLCPLVLALRRNKQAEAPPL